MTGAVNMGGESTGADRDGRVEPGIDVTGGVGAGPFMGGGVRAGFMDMIVKETSGDEAVGLETSAKVTVCADDTSGVGAVIDMTGDDDNDDGSVRVCNKASSGEQSGVKDMGGARTDDDHGRGVETGRNQADDVEMDANARGGQRTDADDTIQEGELVASTGSLGQSVTGHPVGSAPLDVLTPADGTDGSGTNHAESAADAPSDEGGSAGCRSIVSLPLVRKLRMHMDSCPGTNKSQVFYGGLGLVLATELLDCAMVLYMVVGHTKFSPDMVARQIAGKLNKSDYFNLGQLLSLMRPYATAGAYDHNLLHTWKAGAQDLFEPITHIMSYRNFLLLADDGHVNLAAVAQPPDGFEPFADRGPIFAHEDLMQESNLLDFRALKGKFLPEVRAHSYSGVGQAAVPKHSAVNDSTMLLPSQVARCRKVHIFARRSTADTCWQEHVGWMKSSDLTRVNAALASIQPYRDHPETREVPYGAKAKSIEEQNAKYVPREFVPDSYNVPMNGYTGVAKACHLTEITSASGWRNPGTLPGPSTEGTKKSATNASVAAVEIEATRGTLKRARWSSVAHKHLLVKLLVGDPFFGQLPSSQADWDGVAARMPAPKPGEAWDVSTIKRHAKALATEHSDIHV